MRGLVVGMAGTRFLVGYDGLSWVMGWTGGLVLVSILIGPYLRKFGDSPFPSSWHALRRNFVRSIAVFVRIGLLVQLRDSADLRHWSHRLRFPGMQFDIGVFVGLVGILLCSFLGGMSAVTWPQVAQYIVLLVAYLTPIVILSEEAHGVPIPELALRNRSRKITAANRSHGEWPGDGRGAETRGGGVEGEGRRRCPGEVGGGSGVGACIHWIRSCSRRSNTARWTSWRHRSMMLRHRGAAAHPDALFHHPVACGSAPIRFWSLFVIFLLYFTAPASRRSRSSTSTPTSRQCLPRSAPGCSDGAISG